MVTAGDLTRKRNILTSIYAIFIPRNSASLTILQVTMLPDNVFPSPTMRSSTESLCVMTVFWFSLIPVVGIIVKWPNYSGLKCLLFLSTNIMVHLLPEKPGTKNSYLNLSKIIMPLSCPFIGGRDKNSMTTETSSNASIAVWAIVSNCYPFHGLKACISEKNLNCVPLGAMLLL